MHNAIRFTSLILLSICSTISLTGQGISDDFEGNSDIDWLADDCNINTQFSNPFNNDNNPSNTVLRYGDIGGLYANTRFDIEGNFDLSEGHLFSLKVYVPSGSITGSQPNQISLKLQNSNISLPWTTQTEIIKPLELDQWQTITFNFTNDDYINNNDNSPEPSNRGDLNRVVIQLNGEGNTDFVLAYIDDFNYTGELGSGNNPTNSIYNELVWSDEFDSPGAIDSEKWFHQTELPNGSSWFNGEVQHYTDRTINSFVEDGALTILAKRETFTDQGYTKEFTSARLNSKFAFTYGRVVVRAILPEGVGTWPAIWMLGKNISEDGGFWAEEYGTTSWPACGEIDIMEHWGNNQNYVQSAMHTPSSFGATENHGGLFDDDVSENYHTYMVEWLPTEMRFSIDGNVYYTYAPSQLNADTWPFDADQYILLNTAIQQSISPNFTESPFVIDYVRVYQESTLSVQDNKKENLITLYPNPSKNFFSLTAPQSMIGAKATVYSSLGVAIDTFYLMGSNIQKDISDYAKGTYIVVVENNESSEVLRFVKY